MSKLNRFIKTSLAVLLVASLAIVIVPSAEAQVAPCGDNVGAPSMTPTLSSPSGRVKPITDTAQLKGKIVYEAPEQASSITPIKMTITARAENPSWAVVTVSPSVVFFQIESNGKTTKTIEPTVSVALTKDAPAFAQQNIYLKAETDAGTCVKAAPALETPALIKADFYERTQARFGKTILQASQNDQVSIPLTIENFGNGAISVVFKNNEQTSKNLVLALPGLQIIPSTIAGGETSKLDIPIDVKTPFKNGYENRQDQLVIDIQGTSADDASVKLNTPLQVSAVIQTQGVYVPGFEAVTLITALLGAVLAHRRLNQ